MSLYLCILSYMCVGMDKSKNHGKQAKTGQKPTRESKESKAGAEAVFYQPKPNQIELTRDRSPKAIIIQGPFIKQKPKYKSELI